MISNKYPRADVFGVILDPTLRLTLDPSDLAVSTAILVLLMMSSMGSQQDRRSIQLLLVKLSWLLLQRDCNNLYARPTLLRSRGTRDPC